jgi:coenzyme F420-reducing hydrogenase delta subunit
MDSTMSMTRTDLAALKELSFAKDLVSIERIPCSFMSDFDVFFFGKTLVKGDDGILFAYPHDIRQWVKYLFVTYSE